MNMIIIIKYISLQTSMLNSLQQLVFQNLLAELSLLVEQRTDISKWFIMLLNHIAL